MQSIRVICLDSYQAAPIPDVDPIFSHFRGSDVKLVPVLRIFGVTLAGEKVCLHIHGVFPYMYVPYSGQINPDILAYRLAESLDAGLNVSLGSASSKTQHIYKIQQVSGIPFYGYHRKNHHFFKIYFYNPVMVKKATALLYSGSVLDQTFQPHEAHIPYTVQFMIDYNVYGMSTINLKSVRHRYSTTDTENHGKSFHTSDNTLNLDKEEKQYMPFSVTKQSVCQIEIDAWASDIGNRDVIDKGIDLNPGIAAIWQEEKARRAQAGLGGDSQLTHPKSPERSQAANLMTDNDLYHQARLFQRLGVLESQGDESSLSLSNENMSYPVVVPDNSKLLNASRLEIHAGPLDTSIFEKSQRFSNTNHESLTLQSQSSFENLTLDSSDLDFVDILVNLDGEQQEQEETRSQIDDNSILGTQRSQKNFLNFPSDQNTDEDDEEENEENPDLNLTTVELDTHNFTSWKSFREMSEPPSQKSNNSQIELALEPTVGSDSSDVMPQLDGPIDDDDVCLIPPNKDEDNDITIERHEHVVCDYRPSRGGRRSSIVTTPRKRKRPSSSDDEDSRDSVTKQGTNERLPRTPRRTPKKRSDGKITSPSCPERTYSPLNVEVSCRQRTPKSSPRASTSTRTPTREISRINLSRKIVFSPVKELQFEEEHAASTDSDSTKHESKTSEDLFTTDKDNSDSDATLVEDSDDSIKTIVLSPPDDHVIINESDSNDESGPREKLSSLSNYNFPHDILNTVAEEASPKEKESRKKNLAFFQHSFVTNVKTRLPKDPSSMLFIVENEDGREGIMMGTRLTAPARQEHLVETDKIKVKVNCENALPFFSKQKDADAMAQHPLPPGALFRAKGLPLKIDAPTRLNDIGDRPKYRLNESTFSDANVFSSDSGDVSTNPQDCENDEVWRKGEKEKKMEEADNKKVEEKEKDSNSSTIVDSPFDLSVYKGFGFQSEASKHLGVSCGQIEFSNRRSTVNIAHENLGNAKALTNYQFLTILCLEVHIVTRPNLLPDSKYDPIVAIFYAIHNDVPPDWNKAKPLECGVIIADPSKISSSISNSANTNSQEQKQALIYVENEDSLFDSLLAIIDRCDPEILVGWDLETLSWGYVFQRASVLGKNLSGKISRIPSAKCNWETTNDQATQELHIETLAEIKLPGRIVLDIWRIMRYEIALTSYTYENVMFNVMNERVPHYSFNLLSNWWDNTLCQWRVIDHYTNKVIGVHRLLHHLDIINRTSEHARLYGIQFYEVFSRGSQFRVESMMLRLAKPLNYIPVSPSAHQRGCMRAPESLPLIMEPESTMYVDPVVVLDFQSLYPSIIIAYNYCFSTCLGRIDHVGSPHPFEFGATNLKVPKNLAIKLQNKLNYAPCGVAFVKKEVREGILPRMLMEILETRLMVKKAMKDHSKEDRGLQRALHSRQLGLKLIANVTYGYTAANFSGRMPCIEVGDAVVSKGKETLERAIKVVESTEKWGARVIYGDTDSLFVLLKGKTKKEAFQIGAEIADVVTATNPKPIKLKFEKVMMPCILQTKKRYCGYMYENLNDKPVYLAKGIETVRRDGCPAGAKILEKSLRILFETKDLSQVKEYLVRQLDKVLTGRASIQDLTFAKEFRGLRGYKAAACVPALELTKRLMQKDPCAVPRRGSRVPYIIVAGGPNEPLIRCVRSPMEVIQDPGLRPNAVYYITKVIIPPLNRCLNLIGVDAFVWYTEMPHRQALNRLQGAPLINSNRKQKTTISQYLCNTMCPSCGQSCDRGICADCIKNQTRTLVVLYEKCRKYERIHSNIKKMCESCIGVMDADSCTSLDCPIFYRRMQAQRDSTQITHIYDVIQCMEHLN